MFSPTEAQKKPKSSAARLFQRIQKKKEDDAKDEILTETNTDEIIEMQDAKPPEAKNVMSAPQPQPRKSILQNKNKTTGGAVNLSFQPDGDEADKRIDETLVGNEFIENLKDNGQEISPEAKEQGPSDVPPLALPPVSATEQVARHLQIRQDEGFVLGITIHQTDPLEMDYHIRHPMVRVHIVDPKIGNYLAKLDKNRPVSSYYETQHSRSDFILPILTQPYSFTQHRSLVPKWEETIVFNENFYYFSDPSVSAYIVFEVLDNVTAAEVSENIRQFGREAGWIKVAWAFLKVVGKNGQQNTGRRCRLQLYRLPRLANSSNNPPLCEASSWINSMPRIKYPSTIYVTVKALQLPSQLMPTSRSMIATQGEVGIHADDSFARTLGLISSVTGAPLLKSTAAGNKGASSLLNEGIANWSRLPGQVCRLPNTQLSNIFVGQMGCTRLGFSNNGLLLAAAGVDPPSCDYPIVIYNVKGLVLSNSLYGHMNVVYDLCWSNDDSRLVSASSDATARLWLISPNDNSVPLDTAAYESVVLAHPSFVYSAQFHPKVSSIVATGCHDGKIRVWGTGQSSTKKIVGVLYQEIDVGGGLVNALEFDPAGHLLFSGTSKGQLSRWQCNVTAQPNHPKCGFTRDWVLEGRLKAKEIDGAQINRIIRPKDTSRLLVHTRDNAIRMYDLMSEACTQLFTGHINARDFIGSCITPCGTFVLGASEVGTCFVWNAITTDVVTIYDKLSFANGVTDVQFHPHEHMVAFCSYGESQSVYIYGFDEAKARLEAEYLKRVERGETMSEQKLKTLEPDRFDRNFEINAINEQIARGFAQRVDKVNKALSAVAPMPNSSFKQSVVDSLIFGGPQSLNLSSSGALMNPVMTSTQFAAQPVINFNISADGDKVETEIKAPAQPNSATSSTAKKPEKFLALYDYEPQRADEMALRKGDIIVLLCRESERWWLGENLTLGGEERGYFPANYVAPTEQSRRKAFRMRTSLTTPNSTTGGLQTLTTTPLQDTAKSNVSSLDRTGGTSSIPLFQLEPMSSGSQQRATFASG